MTNIVLIALLLTNVAVLAVILSFGLKIRRVYGEFTTFFTAPDDKTPSPFAQLTCTIADTVARSLIAQAKASFMGTQSGAVRANNAVEADIAMDAASAANPLIGTLLNSFPTLRKTLRRNPQLISLAAEKLLKPKVPSVPTAGGNGHSQSAFKI